MPYIKELQKLILNRKSTRNYDSKKKIDEEKISNILNDVRHTPSSYGLEPWKILVISNPKVKLQLQPIINNQQSVVTASHLFILLSYNGEKFNTSNPWFKNVLMKKRNFNQQQYDTYLPTLQDFFVENNSLKISQWAQCQTYLLLQNLLLLLTAYEIDSLVMGGFNEEQLLSYLQNNALIEPKKYHVAVVVAAGYGYETKTKSYKNEINEMSEIIQ